jgi:hypothetical protein
MINFYHNFVSAEAKVLRPLTDLLKKSPKATMAVKWTWEMEKPFISDTTALCKLPFSVGS